MKRFCLILITVAILSIGCKRDKITTEALHGMVHNLCTDKGISGVTIYLKENGSDIAHVNSDANGNFSFGSVQLHSSKSYELDIPTASGIGTGQVGFDGENVPFSPSDAGKLFNLYVVPRFKFLHFLINPSTQIIYPDTIVVSLQQNTFHKNVSNLPYSLSFASPDVQPGFPHYSMCTFGDYPMGWWHVIINKTKGGVNTITNDSIYVDWGADVTDTIPW